MEVQRREVAHGEDDVQSLHAFAVVEEPAGDALGHLGGDLAVDGGEVAHPTAVLQGLGDDGVESLEDLLDGLEPARRPVHAPCLITWDPLEVVAWARQRWVARFLAPPCVDAG